jgi:ABC-type Fe3+-hydroxamate transport system substrate-binding protein
MPLRLIGFVLLPALLLVGCESPDADRSRSTVTDALGRPVQFDRPVERVVSLAPNLTELAYAAGAGSTLVAVTKSGDHPPAVDTLDHVSALPVDFEAIVAKRPDLVLATDQINPPGDTETFDAVEVPIYFFSFGSLDDVFGALRTLGDLLGTGTAARDSARALERRVSRLRARTDSLDEAERPRVLVLIGDDTLYSFGRGSYVHELVRLAGGRSVTASIETSAPTLSEEYVLNEKPDVIVGAWGSDYDPDRLLALHPTWDVVPAIRQDRVYSLPSSLLLRPGPRLVEGARRMAARLHPGRFARRGAASPAPKPSASPSPAPHDSSDA